VIMALASVALIRSVDTSTMIAGNLAFRQAATSSGDAGINAAIVWLNAAQSAMDASGNDVYNDPGCPTACVHTFNATDAAQGYYSNADATINPTDSAIWDAIDQSIVPEITDSSGNRIRYVIQRMCNTANVRPSTGNCLFSSAVRDEGEQTVKKYGEVCNSSGCTPAGKSPLIRITARITGPRNTISYVQSFVY
jgi:type IV pilus assembly protein PilX